MAINNLPIEKFGTKLMVASKSVNKIPSEYMKLALNARIFDGWIWPRLWKILLTDSTIWTFNKGGFLLDDKLYQITNSNIYEIDKQDWTQTLIDSLWHDVYTDILVYGKDFAIIVAEWEPLKVFDWATVTTPATVPAWDTWSIIEYTRWFSFYAINNILYISRPITDANPEYAYDFTGTGSQNIVFDSNITWLKGTLTWLYVFTEDKVEYIGANAATWPEIVDLSDKILNVEDLHPEVVMMLKYFKPLRKLLKWARSSTNSVY